MTFERELEIKTAAAREDGLEEGLEKGRKQGIEEGIVLAIRSAYETAVENMSVEEAVALVFGLFKRDIRSIIQGK